MVCTKVIVCMRGSRGGTGRRDPPEKLQKYAVSNTGPDPLNNHIGTKSAFNVGPSLARQRNAILMAFPWRANDGPLLVVFGFPYQLKKRLSMFGPL